MNPDPHNPSTPPASPAPTEVDADVIVIGGGPAGSTAAMVLAKTGKRVLVFEKERFPRYHIGESLLPYNEPLFDQLGLRDLVACQGYVSKRGARFFDASGTRSVRFEFQGGRFNEHHQACHVERASFDQLLLDRARELGAEVHEQTTVTAVEFPHPSAPVTVHTRSAATDHGHAATDRCWRARFVIDASGLGALTAVRQGAKQPLPGHRRVALFSQFSGVLMEQNGDERGDIILVRFEHGWAWFIPLQPDRVSVGIVIDQPRLRELGLKPEAAFHYLAGAVPELRRRLAAADRIEPVRAAADYSFLTKRLTGPRLIRVGDAAGFLDPIFSSGVLLAMKTGRAAALCAAEAIDRGQARTRSMRVYERQTRRHMRQFWRLIDHYYSPEFLDVLMTPEPPLQLPAGVGAILVGRDRLPFGARWRLALFYLVVRLQRRLPLVPRVPVVPVPLRK